MYKQRQYSSISTNNIHCQSSFYNWNANYQTKTQRINTKTKDFDGSFRFYASFFLDFQIFKQIQILSKRKQKSSLGLILS